MELIKIKEVTYKVLKKPENIKMSDWSNFWKDKLDNLDRIQRYPASHAGESPFKDVSDDDYDDYVESTVEEFGDELTLSIEFTNEEALSIADPAYGFMSHILDRVRSKSNLNRNKEKR